MPITINNGTINHRKTNHGTTKLEHGGDLDKAILRYGGRPEDWLDMSTGISPWAWPVPDFDKELWHRLPSSSSTLLDAAASYYEQPFNCIAVTPGSQLAIRLLPQLFEASTVAVPLTGYQEHQHSWRLAGHQLVSYNSLTELAELAANKQIEHAVLISPNNPSGELAEFSEQFNISQQLNGYLIVDQAFADCVPGQAQSSAYQKPQRSKQSDARYIKSNIITLRSLGKFFGLAGLRVGFVLAEPRFINAVNAITEPWSISGPSLELAEQALRDTQWQKMQRQRIETNGQAFKSVLLELATCFSISHSTHSGLFHTLFGEQANIDELHHQLAKVGIWTRHYNRNESIYWLRLSLPKSLSVFTERCAMLQRPS